VDARAIWDRRKLDLAIDALAGYPEAEDDGNEWDWVLKRDQA
jgi:hypothetical protein